jgi:hypothetical protein
LDPAHRRSTCRSARYDEAPKVGQCFGDALERRPDGARRGDPRPLTIGRAPPIPSAQARRSRQLVHHRIQLRSSQRRPFDVTEEVRLVEVCFELDDSIAKRPPGSPVEHSLSAIGIAAAQLGQIQHMELAARTLHKSRQQQQTATGAQARDLTVEHERPVLTLPVEAVHSKTP